MVSVELSEGITETLDILNHMEQAYTDKIPKKFREFLEKNKSESYISNIDYSKKLNEINLKEKTKDVLATIYMNYWCTPEEKANYKKTLNENEKRYQAELREKYNPDNLFKNQGEKIEPIQNEQIIEETAMVEYKEDIFTRIKNWFKSLFGRN